MPQSNAFLAVRDRAPARQFLDVSYDDIESNPLGVVRGIYEFLGWPLTAEVESRIEAFLEANPKNKHGVHRYSLAEYGLSAADELNRYADYCKRFAINVQADM